MNELNTHPSAGSTLSDRFPPGTGVDAQVILGAIEAWRQEEHRDQDSKHLENQQRLDKFERELMAVSSAVKTGFPDGDLDGHRRYHELLIAREEQKQQIRRELITHLIKTSTWAALVGLGIMLLRSLKSFILE